jgi:hypothetical protein
MRDLECRCAFMNTAVIFIGVSRKKTCATYSSVGNHVRNDLPDLDFVKLRNYTGQLPGLTMSSPVSNRHGQSKLHQQRFIQRSRLVPIF